MILSGIYLNLLSGPKVPIPVSPAVMEAIESIEVTHQDEGRSGFQINIEAGRSGPGDIVDFSLLRDAVFKPFNRIIMSVVLNFIPGLLMDGIITHQQLAPGDEPGASRLTITGEDISVMMDMEEKKREYVALDDMAIAAFIIAGYAEYCLMPVVIPTPTIDIPVPTERTPVQQGTDLQFLREIAERHGYVFYVIPGPLPGQNIAYWGPPIRTGVPQRALSVNMGPNTNVSQINFSRDALKPSLYWGYIQDSKSNKQIKVETYGSDRTSLSRESAIKDSQSNKRRRYLKADGLKASQAYARAQGLTDASCDGTVTATGELDAVVYGGLLQPRTLVDLRGAGDTYSGTYYVKAVTHSISNSEYRQRFTLNREGTGELMHLVIS